MKKIFRSVRKYTRVLCGFAASLFILGLSSVPGNTAEYESIKITPPNVGVFAGHVQQFKALGTPKGGGTPVDITNQVDWYLEANPLDLQKTKGLKFKDVAAIDENGLLTTISSWGRLNVSACYPKGCGPNGMNISSILSILAGPKFLVTPVHTDPNGSIAPAAPMKVKLNNKASFTITPQLCYNAATPDPDTCGGTFTDNSTVDGTWDYTVDPVSGDCSFTTVFVNAGTTYDITPINVTGGTYPAATDPVTANCGVPADLVFDPTDGTHLALLGAADTCDGTLTKNDDPDPNLVTWTYSVAGRATDCSADIVFEPEVVATPLATGTGGQTADSPKTVARTTPVSFTFSLVSPTDTCTDTRIDTTDASQCNGAQLTDNGDTTWTYSAIPLTFSGTCNATVEFFKNQYDVTPISVTGGSYPAGTNPVTADCGSQVDLVFDPTVETDVAALGATDTCSGTLTKNSGSPVTWTYSIASLTGDCAVTVNFVSSQQTYTLTLTAANDGGDGRVYSSPAGPDCDSSIYAVFGTCPSSSDFNSGTVVTLKYQTVIDPDGTGPIPPQTLGTFAGWSGDPDCSDGSVTMNKNINCTATFTAAP